MTIRIFPILSLILLSFPAFGAEPPAVPRLEEVEVRLREVIRQSGAELVGLAVHDLETGRQILIDERISIHAASTMKVPVMMEVFRLVAAGQLRLSDRLPVTDRFSSIVDGSEYRLTPDADSDQEIYRQIGRRLSVRDLVDRMITRSSNLATNILIQRVQPARVGQLMRQLGANDIQVRRGVEDSKAFQAGLNNTTTAYDLMLLLRAIASAQYIPRRWCAQMISILAAQQFNEGIPAGLPPGTRVAHKTGEITRHNHDAAIIFVKVPPGGRPRPPYVLVILTRGLAERTRSDRLIADLTAIVHQEIRPR